MNCQKCGAVLEADARFCQSCGTAVQTRPQTQTSAASTPTGIPGAGVAAGAASAVRPGAKSKSTAMILEIVGGLFGFLGIGWLYACQTQTGLLIMFGNIIAQIVIALFTLFVGVLCTLPIAIGLSAYMLNEHIKKSPDAWT